MSAFPLLSRTISSEMFSRLIGLMPPLIDDSMEAMIARDGTALAHIAALGPIRSAEEASLAVTVVAADCHAHDALRSAGLNAGNLKIVMQCRSQAMMMLRTRAKAVERLERLQAEYAVEAVLEEVASARHEAGVEPKAEAPPQADTQAATPEPRPAMSPAERDRKRAAITAIYARLAGRPAPIVTNIPHRSVSSRTPDAMLANPAVITTRVAPLVRPHAI